MKTLTEILAYIEENADERELRLILAAYSTGIRRARAVAANELRSKLEVGDTVQIKSGLKPKYLVGVTGKVHTRPVGDKVMIDMGGPIRRYSRYITVPLSCLTKVG